MVISTFETLPIAGYALNNERHAAIIARLAEARATRAGT
jgi:hypothetical protein